MTESQFSAKLLRALRQRMPNAVVWKLNDRFTSGIPDAVVVYEGMATWLEMKMKHGPLSAIQYETLKRLKRGYVVRYFPEQIWVSLMTESYGPETEGISAVGQGVFETFAQCVMRLECICKT